jgi:PhnB protein
MMTINPSLNFDGNAEEAFTFYQTVFGGELKIIRYKDYPDAMNVAENEKEKIMHASLQLNKGNTLMGGDFTTIMEQKLMRGNSFSIVIQPESKEEADTIFAKLSVGGKIIMPMEVAIWGDYFGMFKDKFGIEWQINVAA